MSQNSFHGDWEESERFAPLLQTRERNARTCAPSCLHQPTQYHVQQTAIQNVSSTTTNQAAANEEPTDDADDAAAADTKTGSKTAQKQAAAEDGHNSKSKTRKNKPKNSQAGRQAQILASGYTAVTGSNPLEVAVKMICIDVEIYTSSILLLLLLLLLRT